MGLAVLLALAVNLGVAMMLYACRDGVANMNSVRLCSRNDAISNVSVMFTALGCLARARPDLVCW